MVVYWIANPVLSMRASVPKKDYAESDHAFYLSFFLCFPETQNALSMKLIMLRGSHHAHGMTT